MPRELDPHAAECKRQKANSRLARVMARASIDTTPPDIGFMARLLIQATMPHKKSDRAEHVRKNGNLTICMLARREVGLPFGTYPRLILYGLATEVVRTGVRDVELGGLCEFMRNLGLKPTGGKNGSIGRLRDHMKRLFSCAISWTYDDGRAWIHENVSPVERAELWWDPESPRELGAESCIRLSVAFHREILAHHVPLDMKTLRVLAQTRSPLALDIYSWLTHRMSYLTEPVEITWGTLALQFGAEYGTVKNFRQKFLEQLRIVKSCYPALRVVESTGGLTHLPSPTHNP